MFSTQDIRQHYLEITWQNRNSYAIYQLFDNKYQKAWFSVTFDFVTKRASDRIWRDKNPERVLKNRIKSHAGQSVKRRLRVLLPKGWSTPGLNGRALGYSITNQRKRDAKSSNSNSSSRSC